MAHKITVEVKDASGNAYATDVFVRDFPNTMNTSDTLTIPTELKFFKNEQALIDEYERIIPIKSSTDRTKIFNTYLEVTQEQVDDPTTQWSAVIQAKVQAFLESIWGEGNVVYVQWPPA